MTINTCESASKGGSAYFGFQFQRYSLYRGEGMAIGSLKGRGLCSCDFTSSCLGGGQEVDSRQEEGPVLNLQGPPLVIQSSSATPKKVLQLSEAGVPAKDQMFRHMNDGWTGHFTLKPQLPMHSLLL